MSPAERPLASRPVAGQDDTRIMHEAPIHSTEDVGLRCNINGGLRRGGAVDFYAAHGVSEGGTERD